MFYRSEKCRFCRDVSQMNLKMFSVTSIVVCVLCMLSVVVDAFNLSPNPNFTFRQPDIPIPERMRKYTPSYFGYSLVLRQSSLYVGSPRAQSSLPLQLDIKEPGVIYKCSFTKRTCSPFNFDTNGNIVAEPNEYTWDSQNKDHQWLGATMDGGPSDRDRMVVCAPKFFANSTSPEGYLIHGVCYVAESTLEDQPAGVRRISPLRLKSDQSREINGDSYFYNAYAEMGFSLHNVESKDEIIFGAPGLATWKGSMVRNRVKDFRDQDVSRSRRDTHSNRSKREFKEYINEVLQPELWGQHNDSYFGYAVSSGYFHGPNSTELLYLATAPQSDSKDGEAYLFSIEKNRNGSALTIARRFLFEGTQFGEYFGYSILAEDVNGDNYTDVIVSAPNHCMSNSYENGAIYVFLNLGDTVFSSPTIIRTGAPYRERFGSTLSKLGDINLDGYNDIAVGAPFSGNGVVYVYLGGPNGLRLKPSQILISPAPFTATGNSMFGFGLSRGVDIDSNGFNDLAVGDPGDDKAYLYRSYPVVKIIASIDSPRRQIQIDQKKMQITTCWQLQTKSKKIRSQDVNIHVNFDPVLKRVRVSSNETVFKAVAKINRQCKTYDATVKVSFQDIFRPIVINMSYELSNKILDTREFCENCVVVDPDEPKFITQKIPFKTGCKLDVCVANLKINSNNVKSPFILGSSESILVKYTIRNDGETAYLPQLNVTSSNKMPFTKIPSACKSTAIGTLECYLNDYRPLGPRQSTNIAIDFDSSNVQGTETLIRAQVFSVGNESNPVDNIAQDVIKFAEFSQLEVSGKPSTPIISLDDGLTNKTIQNHAEIQNFGPSSIKQLEVKLSIPLAYVITGSQRQAPLIDFTRISLKVTHNNRILDVTYIQNGSIVFQNPSELSSGKLAPNTTSPFEAKAKRLLATNEDVVTKPLSNSDYQSIAKRQVDAELAKELSGTLPINRTVFLNCYDNTTVKCVEAIFLVNSLPKNGFIDISFEYNIDLKVVNKILIPEKDFFVISTKVDVNQPRNLNSTTVQLISNFPYNIISKHHSNDPPVWLFGVSAFGGLLILLIITYGMYKLKFFERKKRKQLHAAQHETQPLNPVQRTE